MAVTLDIDEILLCNIRAKPQEGADAFFVEDAFAPPTHVPGSVAAKEYEGARSNPTWPRDEYWAHLTHSKTGYNPSLPGARELLEGCSELGLDIFLVTGRDEALRKETVENLTMVGLVGSHTQLTSQCLLVPNQAGKTTEAGGKKNRPRLFMYDAAQHPEESKQPFKERSRKSIAETHHIVLNLGDQLSDLGRYGHVQELLSHPFYHTE